MTAQDKFIFILTFITGLAAGMYVYVVGFKPTYAPETISNIEESAQDFSVIGKEYGIFNNDHIPASFRLIGDGSFDYRPGGSSGDSLEPLAGEIPRAMINDIRELATEDELSYLAEPLSTECDQGSGDIDYQYRVILEGSEYTLDSCQTRLGHDSDLALVLEDVWSYLDDPDAVERKNLFGDSFYDTSVNFIRDHLSPYEE